MTIAYRDIPKTSSKSCKTLEYILKKRGFSDTRLVTQWQNIVGQDISKLYSPNKINFFSLSSERILELYPLADFARVKFGFDKELIKLLINTFYGYNFITNVKLAF
jgi:hypothetical protein